MLNLICRTALALVRREVDPEVRLLHLDNMLQFVVLGLFDECGVSLSRLENNLQYHYTNLEALFGILGGEVGSPGFLLSDVRTFADAREITAGMTCLKRAAHYGERTADLALALHQEDLERASVVCFCGDRDAVSQWQIYGKYGQGASIGASMMHYIFRPNVFLVPVIYDQRKQSKIAQAAVDLIPHGVCNEKIRVIQNLFSLTILGIKAPGYSHEQEVRIVKLGAPEIFKSINGRYLRFSWFPFCDVNVGWEIKSPYNILKEHAADLVSEDSRWDRLEDYIKNDHNIFSVENLTFGSNLTEGHRRWFTEICQLRLQQSFNFQPSRHRFR